MIEITGLGKINGPLTKRIYLDKNGRLVSDGSACVMGKGQAKRVHFDRLADLAALLGTLEPHEAIALGRLRADLPDLVDVATASEVAKLNGATPPNLIARTGTYIVYTAGEPALVLIDIDTKAMPEAVRGKIKEIGGFWEALVSVLPALAGTARIVRRSTTTGISRTDTGEALHGSNGLHIYLQVQDGGDAERFLRTFHERLWLHGFGWHMVGAGGQLLDRSLVDRMVYAPERLVFEGAPVLVAPLIQDCESRKPTVHDGEPLDTKQACPPLRVAETSRLDAIKARSAHALAPARVKERDTFVTKHTERLAESFGIPGARRMVERWCDGILLPDIALPFDDHEFAGCTVADVLADPARFAGATMADPLEGVGYGICKAKIMRRPDGTPWIHSFAHGRTIYKLQYDARAVAAAIEAAPDDKVVELFTRFAINADLGAEEFTLRNRVAERSGVGKRALDAQLKAAKKERDDRTQKEEQERKTAERDDPRPQIPAPPGDAPWLPVMGVMNDILDAEDTPEPRAMRDIDGHIVEVRVRRVPNMHHLTAADSNEGEAAEEQETASEQPLLTRLDETQLSELIERHIDFVNDDGRSVHLAKPFVQHYMCRTDGALPVVAALATLPILTGNGRLLSGTGLNRPTGIFFRVPQAVLKHLPDAYACNEEAVFQAMHFLVEQWLGDVSTDFTGKCILIAAALTIIERSILAERPAFFVTAARRGGGKTTVVSMLMAAVTGYRPSAAAWSFNDEERRKALLSYLMTGLPAIIWDNIPRGAQISCPHIEASLTASFFSDRKLGFNETVVTSAATVHLFTGNNIGPKGDLASRSLQIRLEVDRPDPENRNFIHPDPIGWTETHRGQILGALYSIMLANPELSSGEGNTGKTRFKAWWRLVGSAVEHAATVYARELDQRVAALVIDNPTCKPKSVSFQDLFITQEIDDEHSSSLVEMLKALDAEWPKAATFDAQDVARMLNNSNVYTSDDALERTAVLREFLFPKTSPGQTVTAKSVSKRLRAHVDEPVMATSYKGGTLTLRTTLDQHTKVTKFHVRAS